LSPVIQILSFSLVKLHNMLMANNNLSKIRMTSLYGRHL
jgi:hypothetical protein